MEYITAAFGLLFCLLPFWAYRRGIKDGLALSREQEIAPIKGPIQQYRDKQEAKKAKAAQDDFNEQLSNLFNFDGTPQKKVVDDD